MQFASDVTSAPKSALFARAFLINVTNREAFIFVGALSRKFVDDSQSLLPQYLISVVTSVAICTVVMFNRTWLTYALRSWLISAAIVKRQEQFLGSLFVIAGCLLALY